MNFTFVYFGCKMGSVDTYTTTKLNRLLKVWPHDTVAVHPWLRKQGISRDLAKSYVRLSWLNRLGHGAYSRADSPVQWPGGLYSIQRHLNLPIHAGGVTALQLLGHAQFLPIKEETVHLFGPRNVRLPAWFRHYSWGGKVRFYTTSLFPFRDSFALLEKNMGAFSILISSLERAMLEYLFLATPDDSFGESRSLMEGLVSLRPKVVQNLLEKCGSVKSKRLFLALADQCRHPWMKDLRLSRIDLGAGKRVFQKGGHLHSKFQITLPAESDHG